MSSLSLILIAGILGLARAADPSFPYVANDFSVRVEVNMKSRSATFDVKQVYDYTNNRMRLETYAFADGTNTQINTIEQIDYNALKKVTVTLDRVNGTSSCVMSDLTFRDLYDYNATTHHLVPTAQLFHITDHDDGPFYVGTHVVRGIDADAFVFNGTFPVNDTDVAFSMTYYFSVDGWVMPGGYSRVPLRAEFRIDAFDVLNRNEYFDAEFGNVIDHEFWLPAEADCPSFYPRPLPDFPPNYSTMMEVNLEDPIDESYYLYQNFDYDNDRLQIRRVSNDGKRESDIYFFDQMQRYRIIDDSSCQLLPINPSYVDRLYDPVHHHLVETFDFINDVQSQNWTYLGPRRSRGINCDVWFTTFNGPYSARNTPGQNWTVQTTTEWYFTVANWTDHTLASAVPQTARQIPVTALTRAKIFANGQLNETVTRRIEYTMFRFGSPDASAFVPPRRANCPSMNPKPLPPIPPNFSTLMEINLLDPIDRTEYLYQNFDYTNDRLQVRRVTPSGQRETDIYFFDQLKQYRIINDEFCMLTNISQSYLDQLYDPVSHHMVDTLDFFTNIQTQNWTYIGQYRSRGILCDVWSVVYNGGLPFRPNSPGMTWTVSAVTDWYFTAVNWTDHTWRFPGQPPQPRQIPVTATTNAQIYLNGEWNETITRNIEYTAFHFGSPDPSVFVPPRSAHCPSLSPRPMPPLPTDFTAVIEINMEERGSSLDIKEYYDFTHDRVRIDTQRHNHSSIELSNYDTLLRYSYDEIAPSCTISQINTTAPPVNGPVVYDPHAHHIRRTADYFSVTAYNFTYEGTGLARGIPVDVWFTVVRNGPGPFGRYTLEWSWAQPGWVQRGVPVQQPFPVRLVVASLPSPFGNSSSFYHSYEFVDFIPGPPPADVFDVPVELRQLCPDYLPPRPPEPVVVNPPASHDVARSTLAGGVAGAFIGGLIIAFFATRWFYLKNAPGNFANLGAPSSSGVPGQVAPSSGAPSETEMR